MSLETRLRKLESESPESPETECQCANRTAVIYLNKEGDQVPPRGQCLRPLIVRPYVRPECPCSNCRAGRCPARRVIVDARPGPEDEAMDCRDTCPTKNGD